MSFRIRNNISATVQTVTLQSSGAAQLAASYTFPFYFLLRRASDGAVEVGRALSADSSSDLTILRGRLGSTALAFVAGDTLDYFPVPAELGIKSILLGSPALGTATAVHAATTLTGAPQTVNTAITNPDVPRVVSVKGNAAGITGTVTINGTDALGETISEDIALSGASEVFGVKAFSTVTDYDLPAETHVGTDTVSVGVGAALGLMDVISRDTVANAYRTGVREGTHPTVTFGSTVSSCKVTLSSALNGTAVIVDMYVD